MQLTPIRCKGTLEVFEAEVGNFGAGVISIRRASAFILRGKL